MTNTKLVRAGGALALATTLGCAGIWSHRPSTVRLRNMPDGYAVTDNGRPATVDENYSVTSVASSTRTTVTLATTSLGPTLLLDRTIAHDLVITANGRTDRMHIDRGDISGWWVWLDLTVGFGVGAIIDAVSGAWRSAVDGWYDGAGLAPPPAPVAVVAPVFPAAAPVAIAVPPT